jgi:hypothetical protein
VLERLEPLRVRIAEDRLELLLGPAEGEPLDAVGVGVLRGRQAPFGQAQLAQHVVERLGGDAPVERLPGDEPGVEVGRGEERVVVEHLLEVGDEPARVHRVAVEPASKQVVHAAGRHAVERQPRHRECLLIAGRRVEAEEEVDRRGGRELRRRAETSLPGVENPPESRHDTAKEPARERLGRRRPLAGLLDCAHEHVGLLLEIVPAAPVRLGDGLEHLREARHPVARLRREVRPAVERPPVRRQEDGHRPAAVPRHGDDGVHVEAVDVRPLLAVDLDRDEALVHEACRLLVLEGLVLHDVAPVAGGVPDREEDRQVLGPRAGEGLLAPGIPVHRVVCVLKEVGARLRSQAVHEDQPSRGARGWRRRRRPAPPAARQAETRAPISSSTVVTLAP